MADVDPGIFLEACPQVCLTNEELWALHFLLKGYLVARRKRSDALESGQEKELQDLAALDERLVFSLVREEEQRVALVVTEHELALLLEAMEHFVALLRQRTAPSTRYESTFAAIETLRQRIRRALAHQCN